MTNHVDSVLKSRDITLSTKVHLVKAMLFLVVMYRCESWTIKKAEHQRIDAFELWCWRRLLRVPWTTKRSNQPILKEINPEYSLEGLVLELKRQNFGYLMLRANSLEKILMLGKIEGKRSEWQRMRCWYGITDARDMSSSPGDSGGQGNLVCCSPCSLSQTWLSNWTTMWWVSPVLTPSEHHCHSSLQQVLAPALSTLLSCVCSLLQLSVSKDHLQTRTSLSPRTSRFLCSVLWTSVALFPLDSQLCQIPPSLLYGLEPHSRWLLGWPYSPGMFPISLRSVICVVWCPVSWKFTFHVFLHSVHMFCGIWSDFCLEFPPGIAWAFFCS